MTTSSPACHKQNAKSSHYRRQFQIGALFVLLNNALQDVKASSDDCEKIIFNTTSFHCVHVRLFKLFSPRINGESESYFIINTLFFHLLNQILCWAHFMNKIIVILKNSRMKSSMSSLKQHSVIHLKLKFPEIVPFEAPMDILAILKTSHTNLQLTTFN